MIGEGREGRGAVLGIGVVVPHDMALDRELWRWVPDDVSLLLTRTPPVLEAMTVGTVEALSQAGLVAEGVRALAVVEPSVVAYGCASGSFVRGLGGERALVEAMRSAGAPVAVTTSGALLAALRHLGAARVAVATPYHESLVAPLAAFLAEAGVAVTGSAHLGLTERIWTTPYDVTADLVRRAVGAGARPDAVLVSCTNLATYDLLAGLEAELGVPVVSANQATMWAALRAVGRRLTGPGQRLGAG